ncbi:hypothetical protein FCR2A7T_00120 [Flavobacterium cauense R2A-7]|nr:hypothetical protein FCR2A7T_00120 [Flavobacterium cauense R2A-7]
MKIKSIVLFFMFAAYGSFAQDVNTIDNRNSNGFMLVWIYPHHPKEDCRNSIMILPKHSKHRMFLTTRLPNFV